MGGTLPQPGTRHDGRGPGPNDQDLRARVAEILDRWPSAGLAVAVVRDGALEWFLGHGVADVETSAPITLDTVFRIGSITKTFTAIAAMQLWEQGLVDLDAPANDYLRTYELLPLRPELGPATVRHLLTHSAGIGYWRRMSDVLRPGVGSGVRAGRSAPPLAEYYRKGLPVEVEPGSKWMYSNHGFATLGQIVEDVSGQPLDRYLRDHVFDPLGMASTDLVRSDRVSADPATGYVLRSRGLKRVVDREVLTPGASAASSTTRDMVRYVTALLAGGSGEHGRVLQPETLATMFEPHFELDHRIPGMGLGFLLGEEDGRRTVGHDGIVSGFLSQMSIAPDDGLGVVALANTGGLDGRGAPQLLGVALLRLLLGLPGEAIRDDVPQHPAHWGEFCGWYGPDPGPVTNLFIRAFMGAGAEVGVHKGHLMLRFLTPVPPMSGRRRLHPDDPTDPEVFRVDFSDLGLGTLRVVFSTGAEVGAAGPRLLLNGISLRKRPDLANPRRIAGGLLAAGTPAALALRRTRPRRSTCPPAGTRT